MECAAWLTALAVAAVGWLAGVLTTHWRVQESQDARAWKETTAKIPGLVAALEAKLARQQETFERLDTTVGRLVDAFERGGLIRRAQRAEQTGQEALSLPSSLTRPGPPPSTAPRFPERS